MLKKSILTPVLSGVLAVTVVGSGAYYFVNQKNADKDDESSSQSQDKDGKKKGSDSIELKVSDEELQKGLDKATDKIEVVKSSMADQVETVTKAVSGDLDFAYNASLTVTPGEMLTQGADIKSIALNVAAKQKGDAAQLTLEGQYGGQTLATANIIGDRSGGNVYAQVPELSDTYVSVSLEQLKTMAENAIQAPMQAYTQKSAEAIAEQQGGAIDESNVKVPDYNALIEALESVDQEALEQDIAEYAQTIAENFPEGKDAEATKGEVDGVSYELTTKTYDVTEADAMKITKAVIEKAKDDTLIKDFLDNETIKEFTLSDSSAFVAGLDEMLAEMEDNSIDESGEVVSFDVMFDSEGAIAGFKMENDGEGIYAVSTAVGDDYVVDMKFNGGSDADMTVAGVIKNENDTLNGSIKMDNKTSSGEGDYNMVFALKDVKTTDNVMSGTVSFDATANGKTVGLVFTSNSTADKTDFVFSSSMDGKSIFDIAFTLEQTDASDIAVPSDAIAIDLESGEGTDKYAATLDIQGFQDHLKDVLGEELFGKIVGTGTNVIEDAQTATGGSEVTGGNEGTGTTTTELGTSTKEDV